MRLPWKSSGPVGVAAETPGAVAAGAEPQGCPGITRMLGKLSRLERPEILDLGAVCGSTAVFLAGCGARVSVEAFEPPLPIEAAPAEAEPAPKPPIRVDFPDGKFDLVLAWEIVDFVAPERLVDFGAEMRRLLADGGNLSIFSMNTTAGERSPTAVPPRYRLIGDGQCMRETGQGAPRKRWTHPNREIERALAPLSIENVHLQRNQMREFVMFKKPAGRRS